MIIKITILLLIVFYSLFLYKYLKMKQLLIVLSEILSVLKSIDSKLKAPISLSEKEQ